MAATQVPWPKRFRRAVRYWVIRLVMALVALVPIKLLSGLGARFGALAFALAGRDRRRALNSVATAFPTMTEEDRAQLARASFIHFGRASAEMLVARAVDRDIEQWVEWTDESRATLQRALESKRGVIVVGGHIGNWEFGMRRIGLAGLPFAGIAKEAWHPRLTADMEALRKSAGLETIWRGRSDAAKRILKTLKAGHALGMLIDQDTDVQSVFVPFFGVPAKTPRGAADLALRTRCVVLLSFCPRIAPHRYRLEMIEVPVPEGDGEAEVVELTARLTAGIEAAIRRDPEQWVWMHERWKSKQS